MVQMQIHLIQRFLDMMDVPRPFSQQIAAMTSNGAQRTDGLRGPERRAQQTHRMQKLQPLAVQHVGLASRHVFNMPRIDEEDFDPGVILQLATRHHIDGGGLHRDGADSAPLEPFHQLDKLRGKVAKAANRFSGPIRGHAHIHAARGADINPGGIRPAHRHIAGCGRSIDLFRPRGSF